MLPEFHETASLNSVVVTFFQSGGIGTPFNVQHVAHIDADNVQALLQAAQDDPKLLPSFLLPAGKNDDIEKASLKGDSFICKSDLILGQATSLLLFLYHFVQPLRNKFLTFLLIRSYNML